MQIAFAQQSDIPAWLALVQSVQAHFPGLDPASYEAQLRASIQARGALCAVDDAGLWGALCFSRAARRITFLAVHPARRRERIAARLLRRACAQFPSDTRICVTTYRADDPLGASARRFYSACGFTAGKLIVECSYPCQEFFYTSKAMPDPQGSCRLNG